ncbi:nuclear factor NF-kappa-B p105 subunit [Plutella xylostella]|uniref:nuclear factor NF-kappa-B p105 subunit n=1 Tax=Plutella xylostella TaxID=51655 RepID=UPI0020326051|nr:nuclear factor NF-kappa-B p105 subunit [Plutella xylostella]
MVLVKTQLKMQSDQDTDSSTAGASPRSFYIESPHSSPGQQVPYLTNYMTVLSCADNNLMDTGSNGPFLSITEQPCDHFRFRYKSEMVGTHGCIVGKTSASNRTKTYPSVVLLNYKGRATIKCSLAQHNNRKQHPHQLVEDDQERDLSAEVNPEKGYEVGFRGMGIIHTAKKDVPALLYKKLSERLPHFNARELKAQCENEARSINLNIVRLKFSAHNVDTDEEICAPVFSEPIHNMKSAATNDLKICRMSRTSGRPRGGDDVYLLTEKVNKKNIDIRFVQLERGEVCWTGKARFLMSDVHHQYAIVIRTPAYKNPEITSDVKVYVELFRPSDGRSSERIEFTYKAEEVYKQSKKRKANSYSSIGSSSSGNSIKSVSDLPATVIMANEMNAANNNFSKISSMLSPNNIPEIPAQTTVGLSDALYDITVTEDHQMHISPMLCQPVEEPYPLKLNSQDIIQVNLNSKDIDQLLKVNSVPDTDKDFADFNFSDYYKALDSNFLGDGGGDSFSQCIFNSMQLRPDSGRSTAQTQASSSKSNMAISESSKNADAAPGTTPMDKGDNYEAYFTQKDGMEVKKLVKELCDMIRNKTVYKKPIVRAKLERLFELRLSNGDTFLHMTVRNSILPSMQYIVKLIHSVKMVQLLNEGNHLRQTVLHLAVMHELTQQIPYLVAKGCNPMCEDKEGNNAIHYAVKLNRCLKPLLDGIRVADVECDINATNKEKQTPLHLAATSTHASVKLLLSHKASYSARDLNGRTPLHLAAYEPCLPIMEALLEYIPPSDIDVVDGQGYTALQIVCGMESTPDTVKIVELLLQKGADPLISEDHNESAWKEANKKPEVRELMKKYLPSYKCWEDDVKSEDEFESADEGEESGLEALSAYLPELADTLDRSGGWRELAARLQCDSAMSWFEKTSSPTRTLMHQVKECREDVTSLSVAKILRDMGELEAANVILRYVDV